MISATHRDLAAAVDAKTFRLDLYHRLDVFHLEVPPLRERLEDILPLAAGFVAATARRLGRRTMEIGPAAQALLSGYDYPGNVRELKNVVERAVILETGSTLSASSILLKGGARPQGDAFFRVDLDEDGMPPPLRDVDQAYVNHVLEFADGNKTQAARLLGVSFPTLQKRLP